MMTLKNSLAITITIILTILAYVITSAKLLPMLNQLLPSIFVLLTACAFFLVSQLNKSSANRSQTDKSELSSGDITTLYIGNLAYKANEKAVEEHFVKIGPVKSIRLVKDKRTGRRKGFGFVEIDKSDATKFIKSLNESLFMERNIIVRPANEKQH